MAKRGKSKTLSEEDKALWGRVAAQVKPLSDTRTDLLSSTVASEPVVPTAPRKKPKPIREKEPLMPFSVGSKAPGGAPRHDLAVSRSDRMAMVGPDIDRKTGRKLKRGTKTPDARIDLHGMTMAQAHPVLTRFLFRAHQDGHRMVLVITGKGKDRDEAGPMPVPVGVLRTQLPHWVETPPLNQVVLRISVAFQTHGGTGAFYVFLRKRR